MVHESDLSRIGISLPKNLLDKFDEILNCRGYSSRSEGIRDAIRSYITYYQWMSDVQGERQGVITMVYDHEHRGLLQVLTDIQHDNLKIIQSSLHAHVSHEKCLEVILVRGDAGEIKKIAETLMAQKGVESVKLTTIPIEPHQH
ncbi:nickel-responsive transcriptional regulator NikR [Methanomicrobium antiquum]|uniref:Putative nickel-responsive regulator n=1 Tax=Methanomicrobium antiquum TaxID=487686 RepID=A0AAF0JMI1_9EURY|nr:nickel-responsive transcriptional regulator NikR [Methanomicrobium antiquum]MDD3978110.1 nickel-responsive transcriptional regulator NikR [Methanomicrobium sp.]WFN36565.1 nickel-responsive transcriptional regulator NikR [Methanomicrobium antiquum]